MSERKHIQKLIRHHDELWTILQEVFDTVYFLKTHGLEAPNLSDCRVTSEEYHFLVEWTHSYYCSSPEYRRMIIPHEYLWDSDFEEHERERTRDQDNE